MAGSGRMVVTASPGAETLIRYGDEKTFAGKYIQAVEFYDQALKVAPGYAKALHRKANALESAGRIAEAILAYDSAIRADPTDAECWFNKGVALKKAGKDAEGDRCVATGVSMATGSV